MIKMNRKRTIAFIGAQSSAKSTRSYSTFLELSLQGHDVGYITEVARDCPYDINEDTGLLAQRWILKNQIKEEMLARSKHDMVVMDRSVIDPVVYSYWACEQGTMTEAERDEIEEYALYLWKTYDVIYLCRPMPLYADGIRSTDEGFQKRIYELFEYLIKKYNIPVHRI